MQSLLTILPLLLLASLFLDMLQGHRFSWSTWLLIGTAAPALLLNGLIQRGPIALASITTFLGAMVLGWLWMNIVQQWPDRLRFVLVRSVVLGGLWVLAALFNLLFDPAMGWLTLLTGILPVCGVGWSAYTRRVAIRIQVAELSAADQEALLRKQQRAVEKLRKRTRHQKPLAHALMGLGASYAKLERMDEAREVFMESGRLYRERHDVDMQTHTLNYLGMTWNDTDPARALQYYELALTNVEAQERRWGQLYQILGWAQQAHLKGILLNNLGSAYLKLKQDRQARPHLQAALDVLDQARFETPRFRVIVYLNLSELYLLMGEEAEARRWAQAARDLLAGRHFMLPAEVAATRKLIARHYRETFGMGLDDDPTGGPVPTGAA